jgi:hypothetical protein
MSNQINKVRREYSEAENLLRSCRETARIAEQEYIKKNGLSVKSILEIEDKGEFERHNETCYMEAPRVYDGEIQAREAFWEKERALIACALSIIPAKLADRLRRGMRAEAFKREIIDTFMRLDSGTVPHWAPAEFKKQEAAV